LRGRKKEIVYVTQKNVSSHHALLSTFTFPFAICLKYSFILFCSVMSAYSRERKKEKNVYYFYKYKYSSILSVMLKIRCRGREDGKVEGMAVTNENFHLALLRHAYVLSR